MLCVKNSQEFAAAYKRGNLKSKCSFLENSRDNLEQMIETIENIKEKLDTLMDQLPPVKKKPRMEGMLAFLSHGKLDQRHLSVSANDELEKKQSKWSAVVNKLRTCS